MLHQARAGYAPFAHEAGHVVIIGVGDGEERETTPSRWHHLDFEPLSDARGDDFAAGQVKYIL
ncbi:MAG: hypothetical protein ACRDP5_17165, partial [Streptosporangiaceae bacterium]